MSKKLNTGLGKGLGALIPDMSFKKDNNGFDVPDSENTVEIKQGVPEIEISSIVINPYQPRKKFEREALEDLKKSILLHGIIQPITVRKVPTGYELIAGERRLRASTELGLKNIPAYIMDIQTNEGMLELAIIENIQRENLNPIEEAAGYQRLIEECGLTQEQVSEKVSKDRTTIANYIRLLKLPSNIQTSIINKEITMGHARALLSLVSTNHIEFAWHKITSQQLSVRATEQLIKKILEGKNNEVKDKEILPPDQKAVIEDISNRLRQKYGTEVNIKMRSNSSGAIEISFYSIDDFERIIELIDNNE